MVKHVETCWNWHALHIAALSSSLVASIKASRVYTHWIYRIYSHFNSFGCTYLLMHRVRESAPGISRRQVTRIQYSDILTPTKHGSIRQYTAVYGSIRQYCFDFRPEMWGISSFSHRSTPESNWSMLLYVVAYLMFVLVVFCMLQEHANCRSCSSLAWQLWWTTLYRVCVCVCFGNQDNEDRNGRASEGEVQNFKLWEFRHLGLRICMEFYGYLAICHFTFLFVKKVWFRNHYLGQCDSWFNVLHTPSYWPSTPQISWAWAQNDTAKLPAVWAKELLVKPFGDPRGKRLDWSCNLQFYSSTLVMLARHCGCQ